MLRLAVGLVALVFAEGCSSTATTSRCPDANREVVDGARVEPSTDFAWLRAYRHYYSITSVGPYAHHFVGYTFAEASYLHYDVLPDGTVLGRGGAWGRRIGERRGVPIPHEQADRALAVERFHEHTTGRKAASILYLGSYRAITVTEMMPTAPPGPPFAREIWTKSLGLRADEHLTRIDGFASESSSSSNDPCVWLYGTTGCRGPHWLDFPPQGGSGFPSLFDLLSGVPEDENRRFENLVLSSARDVARCAPGASLETLLARDTDTLLPAGFSGIMAVRFGVTAIPLPDAPTKRAGRPLVVRLSASEVVRGTAQSAQSVRVGGVEFTATVAAKVAALVPSSGKVSAPIELRYRLSDDRGTVREADLVLRAEFLVDGRAAALQTAESPRQVEPLGNEPPRTQRFPGTGDYDEFVVRFRGVNGETYH